MNPKIKIYGPIGDPEDGVTSKQFSEMLEEIPAQTKTIDLKINSGGGSVSQGISIVQQMNEHPANFRTIIEGGVFSIAGYIAASGNERVILPGAVYHFHGPRIKTDGNLQEHEDSIEELQIATESMRKLYAARTGKTEDEITELFKRDNFFSAEQAVEAGFCTEIGEELAVAARYDKNKFSNPPREIAAMLARAEGRTDEPTPESGKMSKSAATLEQVEAAFENAPDTFILAQIRAKANMETVTANYVKHLETANAELSKELEAVDPPSEDDDESTLEGLRALVAGLTEKLEAMEDEDDDDLDDDDLEAMEDEDDDDELEAMEDEDDVKAMEEIQAAYERAAAELAEAEADYKKARRGSSANYKRSKASRRGSRGGRKKNRGGRRNHGVSAHRVSSTRGNGRPGKTPDVEVKEAVAKKKAADTSLSNNEACQAVFKENPKLRARFVEWDNDPKRKKNR